MGEISKLLAESLSKREQLLKIMSMNNFEMEENSRVEVITEFKIVYGNSLKSVQRIIEKFCPDMNKNDIQNFIYVLFPFIYGIYPYSNVTEKQKEAMKNAGVDFTYHTIYELAYDGIKRILNRG